jgi:hypothetical protein
MLQSCRACKDKPMELVFQPTCLSLGISTKQQEAPLPNDFIKFITDENE